MGLELFEFSENSELSESKKREGRRVMVSRPVLSSFLSLNFQFSIKKRKFAA